MDGEDVEAFAAGTLTISEVGGGSVPQLLAINDGGIPVLVLDGEHLEGAMQDRVLNTTVLLPAKAKTVIPVSCVEHGRWHYEGGDTFAPSQDFSYSRLRSRNVESVTASLRAGIGHTSDQGAIWDDVAAKHDELSVEQSATGAMKDAFEVGRSSIGRLTRAFSKPQSDQTGVIACVAGEAVALDAFDRSETLKNLWPRLVSGYAMDAVGAQEKVVDPESAKQLLAAPIEGEITAHDAIGLGTDLAITSKEVVGKALLWGEGRSISLSSPAVEMERRMGQQADVRESIRLGGAETASIGSTDVPCRNGCGHPGGSRSTLCRCHVDPVASSRQCSGLVDPDLRE